MKHEIMEPWTASEDECILDGLKMYSTRWALIQKNKLPYRTVSSIRNRHQRIQRGMRDPPGRNRCLRCGQLKKGHSCGRLERIDIVADASIDDKEDDNGDEDNEDDVVVEDNGDEDNGDDVVVEDTRDEHKENERNDGDHEDTATPALDNVGCGPAPIPESYFSPSPSHPLKKIPSLTMASANESGFEDVMQFLHSFDAVREFGLFLDNPSVSFSYVA